jgi:peptide/nickel transport system substrate-binding protein
MLRRLTAIALALTFGACTRVSTALPSQRHPWTRPGVLRIADISEPDTFDALLSTMDLVEDLSSLVMSYLVIADGQGRLIGDLATAVPTLANGGISRDGKTYVYHLRRGVRWHDGAPFTSQDVKFTWSAVMNPRNNVFHREGYDEVASIETPDALTAVVHLKERYPPFVTKFFTTLQEGSKPILPAHLLAGLPTINQAAFNAAPVGTGPFRFVRWERGRGIDLAANDAYFKGRPKLRAVHFVVIPADTTILDSLKTHEIDLAVGLPAALYQRYTTLDGVRAALYPWDGETILSVNNGKPGLRRLDVRRALSMAIDYQALIAKVTHGVATPAHDILPEAALGYTNNPPYRYDPGAANSLLDRAGWRRGPDGVRAKNGERLDFTLAFSSGSASARDIAIQLQQWLHDAGMNLALKSSPYNVIFTHDGPIESRRYDLAIYTYTLPYDPDNLIYLGCDQFSPKGENTTAYCDPVVDAGERAGLQTDDPARRAAIYTRVEKRIHEMVPYIPLYVLRRPVAYNVDLKNYDAAPGIAPWWNVWQWEI